MYPTVLDVSFDILVPFSPSKMTWLLIIHGIDKTSYKTSEMLYINAKFGVYIIFKRYLIYLNGFYNKSLSASLLNLWVNIAPLWSTTKIFTSRAIFNWWFWFVPNKLGIDRRAKTSSLI
jgi:hypothetical protein